MQQANEKPSISVFFPVYNDEKTIEIVFNKALRFLDTHASQGEIIIINDGSPDSSGAIADRLVAQYNSIARVIHHPKNLGYGAAVRSGINASKFDWICFTDGDDEYDIGDFPKLLRLRKYYELVITFRYRKLYSSKRIFISWVYNAILRKLFRSQFRDISTGLRMISKRVASDLQLESSSPFIGAEITFKTMLKGYPVGEVGIQTFPTDFRSGSSVRMKNILFTMKDMIKIYRKIFSPEYELESRRKS